MSGIIRESRDGGGGADPLTAQERKRRIKERRSLQRSQSMPTDLGKTLKTANVIINGKRPRVDPAPMDSNTIIRRRGNTASQSSSSSSSSSRSQQVDFEDEPTMSRFNSHSSTVQTRLFSLDSQIPSLSAAVESHGPNNNSLFGRVMQRTMTEPAISITPRKQPYHIADPVASPSQRMARQLASPGGFGLLQMLSTVHSSPFVGKSHGIQKPSDEEEPDEWQEAPLNEILDWTVQSNLRLECHPPSCLPNVFGESFDDWNQAIQYWQYPSDITIADEKQKLMESKVAPKSEKGDGSSATNLAQRLINAVRGPNAHIHRLIHSEEGVESFRYSRQWQDAFQSLYSTWTNKIEEGDKRAYFYTTTPSQVVLFRATVFRDKLQPMVVLSSSSRDMRSKLESSGVTLYVLRGSARSERFRESSYDKVLASGKAEGIQTTDHMVDSMVLTDMEALRRAQAFGETAGADVSVKAKNRRGPQRIVNVPPLYMMGHDDCGAFFTLFLNKHHDMPPVLLTRLGEFHNASLKSLRLLRQRGSEENAHLELRGYILPSTIPAVVEATAAAMKRHASVHGSLATDANGLGSHYFVVQRQGAVWSDVSGLCGVSLNGCKHREHLSGDYCSDPERVDNIVWEISRPLVTTFKLERDSRIQHTYRM
jgi:hypothetical protein